MEEFLNQLLQATDQEAEIFLQDYQKDRELLNKIAAEQIYNTVYYILKKMWAINNNNHDYKNCKALEQAHKVLERKIEQLQ